MCKSECSRNPCVSRLPGLVRLIVLMVSLFVLRGGKVIHSSGTFGQSFQFSAHKDSPFGLRPRAKVRVYVFEGRQSAVSYDR